MTKDRDITSLTQQNEVLRTALQEARDFISECTCSSDGLTTDNLIAKINAALELK